MLLEDSVEARLLIALALENGVVIAPEQAKRPAALIMIVMMRTCNGVRRRFLNASSSAAFFSCPSTFSTRSRSLRNRTIVTMVP
jgi:hypothetical protein